MSEVKLVATARTEFGKGAARRIRRADKVPAVVYGHGAAPLHITLEGHQTMLALKHANALYSVELDGTTRLAIAKDVQRDPIKGFIEHVDLLVVEKGEKIAVDVNVHVTGESAPGTIHVLETQSVTLEAEATHLPEWVEASIEGLEAGDAVRGGGLTLPKGSVYVGDPEDVIVTISVPRATEEETEEADDDAVIATEGTTAAAASAGASDEEA